MSSSIPSTSTTVAAPLVVQTEAEARDLLRLLEATPGPYGLDCETVDVDPTAESPVGRGKIVYWSLAWVNPALGNHPDRGTPVASAACLNSGVLERFGGWLRTAPVVGHNLFSFDRHLFANHSIVLENVVGDTLRMAKFLDADRQDHGLKSWMATAFGYGCGTYEELFSRRKHGPVEDAGDAKHTRRKVDGSPVRTLVCGEYQRLYAGTEFIPLDTIATSNPELLPKLWEYVSLDAKATLELFFLLQGRLKQRTWCGLGRTRPWGNLWQLYENFWHKALYMLYDIERTGILFDAERAAHGLAVASRARAEHEALAVQWLPDVNLNSPQQLAAALYGSGHFQIPPVIGTRKAVKANRDFSESTSEAALAWLQARATGSDKAGLAALLEYKKLTKTVQFLEALPRYVDPAGRIHSQFRPDTRTGRLSSSKPNLQNVPSDDTYGLRSAFVAPPGSKLVVADYGALEPRIQAHFLIDLFGDHSLSEAIATGDVYSGVALETWPDALSGWSQEAIKSSDYRRQAKIVLLAKAYGKGLQGMALQLGKSYRETAEVVERIDAAFPGIPRFQRYMVDYAKQHGGVHTLLGRFRPLPNVHSADRALRGAAERQAYNSPIQGSATDIVTAARLKVGNAGLRIVLEVHDELVVECTDDQVSHTVTTMTTLMERPLKVDILRVPLVVAIHAGQTWAEGKQ